MRESRFFLFYMFIFVLVVACLYVGWESGYTAGLNSPKVRSLENTVDTLKAENGNMTVRIMYNLARECMNQANMTVPSAYRNDWSATITLNNQTLTVTTIIRYDEQANGTMIVCKL